MYLQAWSPADRASVVSCFLYFNIPWSWPHFLNLQFDFTPLAMAISDIQGIMFVRPFHSFEHDILETHLNSSIWQKYLLGVKDELINFCWSLRAVKQLF